MSTLNHEWKQHEMTREYVQRLKSAILEVQDNWSVGRYTSEHVAGTAQLNAEALGFVKGLREAIELIEENQ